MQNNNERRKIWYAYKAACDKIIGNNMDNNYMQWLLLHDLCMEFRIHYPGYFDLWYDGPAKAVTKQKPSSLE